MTDVTTLSEFLHPESCFISFCLGLTHSGPVYSQEHHHCLSVSTLPRQLKLGTHVIQDTLITRETLNIHSQADAKWIQIGLECLNLPEGCNLAHGAEESLITAEPLEGTLYIKQSKIRAWSLPLLCAACSLAQSKQGFMEGRISHSLITS